MHSTGRPSSVHETGLLGFANEYYREMPPTSSTLQTIIANVLSGGGTGSRTTAINNLLRGDDVRAAYADEEMDENKVGSYRLLMAESGGTADRTISPGETIDTSGVNKLYTARRDTDGSGYLSSGSGPGVPGKWVAMETTIMRSRSHSDNTHGHVAMWHRYE